MTDSAPPSSECEALLSFLYMCPVGVLRTNANGDLQMINPEAAKLMLPLNRESMLENLFDHLEDCAPELRGMAARFAAPSGIICEQHRIFISRSGPGAQVVAFTLVKISDDCLMAVLQDMTNQVEQERRLRCSETMFAALFAGVRDFLLFSLDAKGKIDSWNRPCKRHTGFDPSDVIGQDLTVLSQPDQVSADQVAEQVAEAVREGFSLRARWCARSDGTRYWCQVMVAADRELESDGEGGVVDVSERLAEVDRHSPIAGFAVVVRDVTERHVTGEELRRLLTTDYLTGAMNRGHFFEMAEIEIAKHDETRQPVSALMLDLDHFKLINDCFGHAAGDGVLQRFVEVCRTQLRDSDILARMGGEEFVVLLPGTALQAARMVAERICRSVADNIELPSGHCLSGLPRPSGPIGVSIGCATLNPVVVGIDALLKAADTALYAAKGAGRGRVCVARQDPPGAGHARNRP